MKKCWAESLGNCSKKISKEHMVSASLLLPMVTVQGFPWCLEEEKTVSKSSLVKHILCEKHNNFLSVYDSEAKKLLTAFNNFNFISKNEHILKRGRLSFPVIQKIDGYKFERWMLKTLINLYFEMQLIDYASVLPYIFQNKRFDEPFGLSYIAANNSIDSLPKGAFAPFFYEVTDLADSKSIGGCICKFRGWEFLLKLPPTQAQIGKSLKLTFMAKNQTEFDRILKAKTIWHLREVKAENDNGKSIQKIKFIW